LFYAGPHVIVRSDPALAGPVRRALPADRALTAEDLIAALGRDRLARGEVILMHHLYPEDLRRCPPPPGIRLRSLGPGDAEALAALHQACTPAEVEEAEVAVEDEVAFGCFAGPRLVAVASGYRLAGFMDIGVLTHPAFRRRGLGRAVVAAICRWCGTRAVLPLYRCDAENAGSRGVAQAVGFRPYFRQVYLKEIR
jgi:GNAT superfamily N-acetyltransferase